MIPMSQGHIAIVWAARSEDAAVCAERLAHSLAELQAICPALSGWLHVRRKGRLEVTPEPGLLRELLVAGQQKTDYPPRQVMEELGYATTLTTKGKLAETLTLSVNCGGFSPRVLNQCFMEFAPEGELSFQAVSIDIRIQILKALIRAWEPSWGSICSRAVRARVREQYGKDLGLSCGEITFVGADRPKLPEALEREYACEDFAPYGRLVTIEDEGNLDEQRIRRAADLRAALDTAGIFYEYPSAHK